jgi:hypothetical protein
VVIQNFGNGKEVRMSKLFPDEMVELIKDDLFDEFDPDSTEPLDGEPIVDQPFVDPEGDPIGDLP